MSVVESIKKYFIIYNQLRWKPSSQAEINDKLEREGAIQGYNFVRDKRTFIRDMENIESIFNVEIEYDFSSKVYSIIDNNDNLPNKKVLEAFDIINAFQLSDNINRYVHFEHRKPMGTQYLLPLLTATRAHKIAKITHQKFWEDVPITRSIKPLALKEAQRRWYVVAMDEYKSKIKTYGLDRISFVEVTNQSFEYPKSFDVEHYFKYCFGIITPDDDEKPRQVILSFEPDQKKYLETMPLHSTQKVIKDNNKEYRIELTIHITFDFIKEIRSYGNIVKVIQPKKLLT